MGAPVSCLLITGLKISCFIRIGPIATADKAVSIWTAGAVCSIIKVLCRVYLRELPIRRKLCVNPILPCGKENRWIIMN